MIYSIKQGILSTDGGIVLLDDCYAGGDAGNIPDAVNNPAYCKYKNVGPLPPGKYTIGELTNHPHLGPAMPLTPDPANQMYDRDDFFAHYPNPKRDAGLPPYPNKPGRNSSDGCIVSTKPGSLSAVEARRAAGDDKLTVMA